MGFNTSAQQKTVGNSCYRLDAAVALPRRQVTLLECRPELCREHLVLAPRPAGGARSTRDGDRAVAATYVIDRQIGHADAGAKDLPTVKAVKRLGYDEARIAALIAEMEAAYAADRAEGWVLPSLSGRGRPPRRSKLALLRLVRRRRIESSANRPGLIQMKNGTPATGQTSSCPAGLDRQFSVIARCHPLRCHYTRLPNHARR